MAQVTILTWSQSNMCLYKCICVSCFKHINCKNPNSWKPVNSWEKEYFRLTLSILISFPNSVWDLARFFLFMHFTATSQSCFCIEKTKKTFSFGCINKCKSSMCLSVLCIYICTLKYIIVAYCCLEMCMSPSPSYWWLKRFLNWY